MRPQGFLLLAGSVALFAQNQPTFYAAWEDGREAERQGHWRQALLAYQRAVALRPAPAGRVLIYGNNLLMDYYPYTRMARCHLELGEMDAAQAILARAEAHAEPLKEREGLAQRLKELKTSPAPKDLPGTEDAKARPEAAPLRPTPPPMPTPSLPAFPPAPPAGRIPSLPPPTVGAKPETDRARAPEGPKRPVVSPAVPSAREAPGTQPTPAGEPGNSRPRWLMGVELLAVVAGLVFLIQRWLGRARTSHASAFENPERIGPYRLERLLGRGGFASTYLARHEQTGKRVALKLLHPYRQDDPEFLGRFRQEARLGSLLNHPNLVPLVDPGPASGTPWLAMEYVDGQRLDEHLRKQGPLAVPEAIRIARAIASAMAHAHAHGVVHRDLKPGNVMLVGGDVKVMDFGIARTMDSETLTTTYAFLGTPLYAAPEVQFKTQVGAAADCYSLGVMLFEMLAGAPPFKGETPFEILDQHRSAPLPDLRALRPDVPEALVEIVGQLCAKKPEDRLDEVTFIVRVDELG